MDPISVLGLAASVGGLIDIGSKVAIELQKTIHAFRNAPADLETISAEIYTLCGLL